MFRSSVFYAFLFVFMQINIIQANNGISKIITYYSPEYGLHYIHHLNPKETVYSLSKFSGVSVQEIYTINGINSSTILSIDQELIIPVKNESIITSSNQVTSNSSFIKVMYQVKKKDNLFQIAKRYFNTDINTLVERNNLTGLTISPDQILHIGWISFDNSLPVKITSVTRDRTTQIETEEKQVNTETPTISDHKETVHKIIQETIENVDTVHDENPTTKYREVQHTPLHKSSTSLTEQETPQADINTEKSSINVPVDTLSVIYETTTVSSPAVATKKQITDINPKVETSVNIDSAVKKREYPDLSFLSDPGLLSTKGVATWDKNDNEPLNMFVLHKDAKVNSYIRIENPMLGRVVLAKVVARMPSNVYDQDVKMVVSSAVASSLGVKDSRFLAEMKYIQ